MNKRKPPRHATPEEVKRIRALHAQGLTDPEIAARLGLERSNVAVIRGRRLGLPANRDCHFWLAKESRLLIAMAGEGKSRKEIAAALRVPERAVAKHLASLRLGEELDARLIRSQDRRHRAWDLLSAGRKAAAVAAILGLHEMTVRRYKLAMPEDWGESRGIPPIGARRRL